jgi:glutamate formiminotransferase
MKGVKAIGVVAHGRAQLSMNITDLQATPVSSVYAQVCRLADKHGAEPARAEVIGLLPQIAYEQESEWMRLLDGFDPAAKVLERRLESPQAWPEL